MIFKDILIDILTKETKLSVVEVSNLLVVPPNPKLGDFAFPCFKLGKNPVEAAKLLQTSLKVPDFIEKTQIVGPYLNFFVKQEDVAKEVLTNIIELKEKFGFNTSIGKGKSIVIDYSAPNIAKPFSIGHLRSTIIGQCLYNIHSSFGYKVIGVNHLGDWGTQFGKLIVAYDLWGNEEDLLKDPIKYLLKLYVRFHTEAEENEQLVEDAREAFKKLEEGDEKIVHLWEKFKDLSIDEFKRIYKILNVSFDSWNGEAFYIDQADSVVSLCEEKGLLKDSEGAKIIDLEKFKMPPVLVTKSNGTTTYHTRDLATALFRIKKYNPTKILYVVGSEQKLHFRQLFKALDLLGEDKNLFSHVDFGLIRFPEGKMSTRKGRVIFLEDVLSKAINLAKDAIEEKNPDLKNKDVVAKEVGVGAIIYSDLSNDRIRSIDFNWERMLSFEGDTGPYLQYSHARACSIIRKSNVELKSDIDFSLFESSEEKELIMHLSKYSGALEQVLKDYKPHHLTNYLVLLAQKFNEFYHKHQVLTEDKAVSCARLLLVDSTRQVISNGLNLLGIFAPSEM